MIKRLPDNRNTNNRCIAKSLRANMYSGQNLSERTWEGSKSTLIPIWVQVSLRHSFMGGILE